jgi:hypothetical protein
LPAGHAAAVFAMKVMSQAYGDFGHRLATRPSGWLILSVLSIALVSGTVLVLGPSQIMGPWDVFILLEGGWRIFIGQVPHTDFYNPIGPLVYWLVAVGMHIGRPSLAAYVYGNLFFLALVSALGAFTFFRKLPAHFAFLLTLFIAVLIVASRPLGWNSALTTYAMIYNRYGWALISILFVQLFVEDQDILAARSATFDAGSAGVVLGLIFFCKVNFFIIALAAVPLAMFLRPRLRSRIVLTAIGFATVCFGVWLVTGVNALDYIRDIAFAASSQSVGQRLLWLRHSLKANFGNGLLMGGIWWYLIAQPAMRRQASWRHATRTTLILGWILGSALVITIGNCLEQSDVPLFLVSGIILLDAWRREQKGLALDPKSPARRTYIVASLIVVGIFFGGIFGKDLLSLARSPLKRVTEASGTPLSQRFDAESLRDFVIPDTSDVKTSYSRAGDTPARINEGLALLRHHTSPQSRLAVLGLTDPFSFALGLTPPRGAPLWWDLDFSFTRIHFPPPELVFAEATLVMYPVPVQPENGCCWDTVRVLHEIYDGYLRRHYAEVGRSVHWVVLERRS